MVFQTAELFVFYKMTKMKYLNLIFISLVFGSVLFFSCKNDDENGGGNDPCSNDFDQTAMFRNVADNLILPAYQDLKTKVDELETQTQLFLTLTDENELSKLRDAFQAAYLSWQAAAQYEFGPAEEIFLRNSVNNFPVNVSQVEFNIENETNNFDQPDTYDQGFPALDYLLYGVAGNDNLVETVTVFSVNANKEKYKNYLNAIVTNIQEKVNFTFDKWENGYRDSFIGNTGTAAGTSLSLIINGWNQNFELIKREKIGTPSGVLDLNFPLADKVEAYYSGISAQLAVVSLEASRNLFWGFGNGTNGVGLDDFLDEVNAEKNGKMLSAVITDQFTEMINRVLALPDPLSESIEMDATPTINAYTELAKQVVNIKTDLPSILCVSITYIDNPSDSD